MDEVRLTRYIDFAVQEFNHVIGIYPGALAIHEKHGYYGLLWKLGQNVQYAIAYRPRIYEWIDVYTRRAIGDNEIRLYLYYHPMYMWGLQYKIENERIFRTSELKDGFIMPRWTIHETLHKLKLNTR